LLFLLLLLLLLFGVLSLLLYVLLLLLYKVGIPINSLIPHITLSGAELAGGQCPWATEVRGPQDIREKEKREREKGKRRKEK
jgi:hypothetical protein